MSTPPLPESSNTADAPPVSALRTAPVMIDGRAISRDSSARFNLDDLAGILGSPGSPSPEQWLATPAVRRAIDKDRRVHPSYEPICVDAWGLGAFASVRWALEYTRVLGKTAHQRFLEALGGLCAFQPEPPSLRHDQPEPEKSVFANPCQTAESPYSVRFSHVQFEVIRLRQVCRQLRQGQGDCIEFDDLEPFARPKA